MNISYEKMRILIAGLGSIGQRHLGALLAIGERDIILLRRQPERLGMAESLPVFTEIDKALAQKPDIIIIAQPAPLHIPTALKAADAGVHLFIEKPLSHSWEGVEQLRKTVNQKALTAMVGFDLRFDDTLRQARSFLEEGRVGRILAVHAEVGQYLPEWRPGRDYRKTVTARSDLGGGVIFELCHELDYVDWLAGPIRHVSCTAGKLSDLEIDVEDVAVITGTTDHDCIVSIRLDCVQRTPCRQCKFVGSKGVMVVDLLENEIRSIKPGEKEWSIWRHQQSRDDRFREQMEHMLHCVGSRDTPRVTLDRGIEVLALAMAARSSSATGKLYPVDVIK